MVAPVQWGMRTLPALTRVPTADTGRCRWAARPWTDSLETGGRPVQGPLCLRDSQPRQERRQSVGALDWTFRRPWSTAYRRTPVRGLEQALHGDVDVVALVEHDPGSGAGGGTSVVDGEAEGVSPSVTIHHDVKGTAPEMVAITSTTHTSVRRTGTST